MSEPDGSTCEEWQRWETVLQRFNQAWQQGPPPAINDYLHEDDPARTAILIELVQADLEHRLKSGEEARVETYLERYPELGSDCRVVLDLIEAEHALRRHHEPGLTPEEYCGRFPQYRAELTARLPPAIPACLDDERAQTPPGDWATTVSEQAAKSATKPNLHVPVIPGYEILGKLGHGAMGVVYKAWHIALKRLVAIKMIRDGALASHEEFARFQVEAQAGAQLQHANIVQIHEIGEVEGLPFFSLEFVDGRSLARELAGKPLPPPRAARLVEVLARAMQDAHEHGVIHRDLKPGNVLIRKDGTPKITDFGLARRLEGEGLTQTDAVLGTPSYMAPEQAEGKGKEVGPLADVYALGAILYETLTGRPPFLGADVLDTLDQVRNQEPVPPRRLQPKLHRDLNTICLKCLEKDPARRYDSAEALAEDLRRFQAGEPIRARPTPPWERLFRWIRRRPAAAALVLLSVLAVVGVVAGVTWYNARVKETQAATRASTLVDALVSAETPDVPRLISDVTPYRAWAEKLLRERAATAPPESKEGLHVALALLPWDAGQVDFLLGRLLTCRMDEFPVICDALHPHREGLTEQLWAVLEDNRAAPNQRFRAACALAAYDAGNARWQDAGQWVVNQLLIDRWTRALHPARNWLVPPLLTVFRDAKRNESERVEAARLLADYAADRPDVLAEAALEATPHQYTLLFPALQAQREAVVERMEKELDRSPSRASWNDSPLNPAWEKPAPALVQQIEGACGMVGERFALCQMLPLEHLEDVIKKLKPFGYRPIRLRPYAHKEKVLAAAVWVRDGGGTAIILHAPKATVSQEDQEWRRKGYAPVDVAGYRNEHGEVRYAAVWARVGKAVEAVQMEVGLADLSPKGYEPYRKRGQALLSCHVLLGPDGQPQYSAVVQQLKSSDIPWVPGDWRPVVDPDPAKVFELPPGGFLRDVSHSKDGCAVLLHTSATMESHHLHSLEPGEHLEKCRALEAQGYRPASISVAPAASGESLTVASVWHRPMISPTARDALARRQAQAAVVLLRLGQARRVWPLLQNQPDPQLRTYLIHQLSPLGTDPGSLFNQLKRESDDSIRRALILCLGEFEKEQLAAAERQELEGLLWRWYRDHNDPGIHAATEWLLRRWQYNESLLSRLWYEAKLQLVDGELAEQPRGGRRWYVNKEGHTLVIIPGPLEFTMGSPAHESQRRGPLEVLRRQRIDRSFGIASKEVTVRQFRRFLAANPHIPDLEDKRRYEYCPDPDAPILNVTWYEAAEYCNWLSKQEGIPRDQWFYPDQIHEGMTLPKERLQLTGYRLPTDAEWEYGCRAGAMTPYAHGTSEELLPHYAWYIKNSWDPKKGPAPLEQGRMDIQNNRAWPVGRLKPNDLGLFDMHGNAMEWCQNYAIVYPQTRSDEITGDQNPPQNKVRILRGGGFPDTPGLLRSAFRGTANPSNRELLQKGLRVARTIPPNPSPEAPANPPR